MAKKISLQEIRKKPGGSNVGKKTFADGSKRTGPYVGPSGGAPAGSYPIPDKKHARSAIKLAHNAPNPSGIKAAVRRKYPDLETGGQIFKKEMEDHQMAPEQFRQHVRHNKNAYSKSLISHAMKMEDGSLLLYDGGGKHWIQGAVNPKHKGYCTPMTKKTCTPRRKALARTFKKMAHEDGGVTMYQGGGLTPGVDQMSVADSTKVHNMIDPNYDYKAYTPGFASIPRESFGSNSDETNPYKEALIWGGIGLLYLVNPALGAIATTVKLGYDAAGNTFKDRDTGNWDFNHPHSWTTEETVDFGVNAGLSLIAPGVGGAAEKMVAGRVAKGGLKPLVNAVEKSSLKIPFTRIPIVPASESLNASRNFINAGKIAGESRSFASPSIMENFWRNYKYHGTGTMASLLGPGMAAGTVNIANQKRNQQPSGHYQSVDNR